ncbi:hypothetical protein EJB05_26650, partial [Eragrostis curvula]
MAADPGVEEAETRAKQRRGVVAVVALAVTKYLLPVTYSCALHDSNCHLCNNGIITVYKGNVYGPAQPQERSQRKSCPKSQPGYRSLSIARYQIFVPILRFHDRLSEMKVYKVKATELTGNPDTDKLIRDYVASFNEIQQERCRYVELKSVGADAMELEGRMNFINSLVAKSKRMRRPIRRAGGIPREHPPHFKRVPKC